MNDSLFVLMLFLVNEPGFIIAIKILRAVIWETSVKSFMINISVIFFCYTRVHREQCLGRLGTTEFQLSLY